MKNELFLQAMQEMTDKLADNWMKVEANNFIDEVCKELGLCRGCMEEVTEGLNDDYLTTVCGCGERIKSYKAI